jgi:hypothetical protein
MIFCELAESFKRWIWLVLLWIQDFIGLTYERTLDAANPILQPLQFVNCNMYIDCQYFGHVQTS